MGFNLQHFDQADFNAREEDVPVPALAAFFEEGVDPLWRVRGLTHSELAMAEESVGRDKNVQAVIDAMSSTGKEKAAAIKELLGIATDVPRETKKRMEMLVMGSVDPVVELSHAVKLSDAFPIEFGQLTNKILQLTGAGKVHAEVKQKPSGS